GSDATCYELVPDTSRPHFVQLVNSHQGSALQRLAYAGDFDHAAQHHSVVQGDVDVAEAQVHQHLANGVDHLRFGEQGGRASDIHIALIKLAKTSFGRAVGAPHWLDLIALEETGQLVTVLRDDTRQRYGEVVT